jgi:tetratricopeptide (TPR) repeat protein
MAGIVFGLVAAFSRLAAMHENLRIALLVSSWILSTLPSPARASGEAEAVDRARRLVAEIQRADYEGDRAELLRLYEKLTPARELSGIASRVFYWQGFALWRRAQNGFNDSVDPSEIARDLEQAAADFEEALRRDPGLVDAKAAAVSCLQGLTYLDRNDPARVRELVARFVPMLKESVAEAPDNPRVLWIHGASQWWTPPGMPAEEARERRAAGVATYRKGLELARQEKDTKKDALEPSWGEAELLMSLAWVHMNDPSPDPAAAEVYAEQALAIVPDWHYVRDILMVQIRDARKLK